VVVSYATGRNIRKGGTSQVTAHVSFSVSLIQGKHFSPLSRKKAGRQWIEIENGIGRGKAKMRVEHRRSAVVTNGTTFFTSPPMISEL
jgi:hypothetical protein